MHFQMVFEAASSLLSAGEPILRIGDAYLDPGSGSYLLQLLIAGILGSLFVVRASWDRIKGFFGNLISRNKDNAADDEE
jgi:hypothetical protein